MDAIKGSELQIPDAIFAWVLDGQGGVKPLTDNDLSLIHISEPTRP